MGQSAATALKNNPGGNTMPTVIRQLFLCWLFVSLIGIVITIFDKLSAKRSGQRVPEFTLMLVAAIGAALPMYLTMRLIHHKTRHRKFMIGLPLIFTLHILIIAAVCWYFLAF